MDWTEIGVIIYSGGLRSVDFIISFKLGGTKKWRVGNNQIYNFMFINIRFLVKMQQFLRIGFEPISSHYPGRIVLPKTCFTSSYVYYLLSNAYSYLNWPFKEKIVQFGLK